MKSILDRSFQYTPAAHTDISLRFWRMRKAREDGAKEYDSWCEPAQPTQPAATVRQIRKGRQ